MRLLDVNDNYPKLIEKVAFICTKDLKPVILKAEDGDSAPFSQPFVFSFADHKKSPNWELRQIDGKSKTSPHRKTPIVMEMSLKILFVISLWTRNNSWTAFEEKADSRQDFPSQYQHQGQCWHGGQSVIWRLVDTRKQDITQYRQKTIQRGFQSGSY